MGAGSGGARAAAPGLAGAGAGARCAGGQVGGPGRGPRPPEGRVRDRGVGGGGGMAVGQGRGQGEKEPGGRGAGGNGGSGGGGMGRGRGSGKGAKGGKGQDFVIVYPAQFDACLFTFLAKGTLCYLICLSLREVPWAPAFIIPGASGSILTAWVHETSAFFPALVTGWELSVVVALFAAGDDYFLVSKLQHAVHLYTLLSAVRIANHFRFALVERLLELCLLAVLFTTFLSTFLATCPILLFFYA
ncbi:hypothetical protein Pelo_9962 [Pelomyxa schiedti]|nr:hypothetical protein Pelo_9962 [Pelomyxa schiedti]